MVCVKEKFSRYSKMSNGNNRRTITLDSFPIVNEMGTFPRLAMTMYVLNYIFAIFLLVLAPLILQAGIGSTLFIAFILIYSFSLIFAGVALSFNEELQIEIERLNLGGLLVLGKPMYQAIAGGIMLLLSIIGLFMRRTQRQAAVPSVKPRTNKLGRRRTRRRK